MEKSCSLWILVARTDMAFMMHTIPHLVRMCNYPFVEKVLAIDVSDPSYEKRLRPHIGSLKQIRNNVQALLKERVIDKVIDLDYSNETQKRIYQKHFGKGGIKHTHNYKGYPIFGSMYCIERAKGDYFLHFDSDMLLYQEKSYSWVAEGIRILQEHPDVFCVRSLAGPHKNKYQCMRDKDGFFRLREGFTSRSYLIDRQRFNELLPLKILWAQKQGRKKDKLPRKLIEAICNLTGNGLLNSWEKMVTYSAREKGYVRVDIDSPKAWTLHSPHHGKDFIEKLPDIIKRVEAGDYPKEQAGKYDLDLQYWK